ncbi:MAG TPA: hypothetical protein VKP67_04420 [Xanthobacteraceae bacterium]|nr:hypothetical protein [Xanthobacteraceae bacterium]
MRLRPGEEANGPIPYLRTRELVINLRTTKVFGITFPLSLLGRADEVAG